MFYERAIAELGDSAFDEELYLHFTKFEIKHKEFDRARVLFKFALENL